MGRVSDVQYAVTLGTALNLGNSLWRQGRHGEAEKMYREALPMYREAPPSFVTCAYAASPSICIPRLRVVSGRIMRQVGMAEGRRV